MAVPFVLGVGALAYPGHYLAVLLNEMLGPPVSRGFSGVSPQTVSVVVEIAVIGSYWLVLPCLPGIVLRKRS